MIDTITFITSALFRPWVTILKNLPPGWKATACGTLSWDPSTQSMRLYCEKLGLSIYRMGNSEFLVSANLPQLLWGHSGRLIHTPDRFQLAMNSLNWILCQFLTPKDPIAGLIPGMGATSNRCHFAHIGLVWHFPSSLVLQAALTWASHANIRALPCVRSDRTIELLGSFLEIRADRFIKHYAANENTQLDRLRFDLKREALYRYFGTRDGLGFSRITLDWCQATMRTITMGFRDQLSAAEARRINALLWHLEHRSTALSCLEDYLRGTNLKRASFAMLRKLIRAELERTPKTTRLSNLFGNKNWPPVLEVPQLEIERCHEEWLGQQRSDLAALNRKTSN